MKTGVASSIFKDRYYFEIERDEAYCEINKKTIRRDFKHGCLQFSGDKESRNQNIFINKWEHMKI